MQEKEEEGKKEERVKVQGFRKEVNWGVGYELERSTVLILDLPSC